VRSAQKRRVRDIIIDAMLPVTPPAASIVTTHVPSAVAERRELPE